MEEPDDDGSRSDLGDVLKAGRLANPFGPYPNRRPAGDTMQPRPQRFTDPERPALAKQDQKGRLKGVLGVVIVA